ncbi:GvpL/GvpF family gas vesicle protein [Streptomyces sp. G7(2002)]|uniref:GvpL/GvpF family gas vesicle protein n=1 Tax=Streptomyces sp. G7(2002) TaxID=2971798 RepID=UPI00237E1CC0|nr:GvpL/GvpF family gas vesicle protein [Streptomyces sp. G7(2002)]WDT53196.1 GvpL/GvpF family gas vesicle protein [Streptomyces sp. G7(2002)]
MTTEQLGTSESATSESVISESATAAETATYVYAVSRRLDPAALSGLAGLAEGFPVRTLPLGPLTAVVQHVPAAEFTQDAWQRRLSDRAELERCARAHHEVVTAAAACGPTVPLPLATLYRGDERAQQVLGADRDRFAAALARIEGHAEWGVKVSLPTAAPEPPRVGSPGSGGGPSGGAGRAYLDRKRGLHRAREQHHDRALQTAEDIDAALSRLATATRRLRPHTPEMTGERHRLQVLNAAYLVTTVREKELLAAVETLRHRTGAEVEVSGPWVPYSFVGEV